jgi:hypothetical protein
MNRVGFARVFTHSARRLRLGWLIATPLLALSFVATAHATVQCVSANGKVPKATAKSFSCGATVYTTIGDAVAAASAGDTVFVLNGTYSEMVTIPAALTGLVLEGQAGTCPPGGCPPSLRRAGALGAKKTIINAGLQSNGILDQANGVTITGFVVSGALYEGILVEGPQPTCTTASPPVCTPAGPPITNVTISDNVVTGNDAYAHGVSCGASPDLEAGDCGEGLHLDGVAFSTVVNNAVDNNSGGILVTDETNASHDNLILANDVESNNRPGPIAVGPSPTDWALACGITLPSHAPQGSLANVGAACFGVFHNTVAGNTSKGNSHGCGVGVFAPFPGSAAYGNVIAGNQLTDNGLPGVSFHSNAPTQNLSGSTVIGNTIQGNGADPSPGVNETNGPASTTGIEVYADLTAPPPDLWIEGNTISGEANDIWVGAPNWNNCGSATTPCYNVSAYLDILDGGNTAVTGVNNVGTSTAVSVGAADNYWGCTSGPGTAKGCSSAAGNVSTSPFLIVPDVGPFK